MKDKKPQKDNGMEQEHSTFPNLNANHDSYEFHIMSDNDDTTYNITIKQL